MHKYNSWKLRKQALRFAVSVVLVLSLAMQISLCSAPKVVYAYSAAGCGHPSTRDLECNTISTGKTTNNGTPINIGTMGFSNNGVMEEGFCITGGSWAEDTTYAVYTGNAGFTYFGGHLIGVQEKGWGNTEDNARYITTYILDKYYNYALDNMANEPQYQGLAISNATTGASYNHVMVAAAVAEIIHAWFDTGENMANLTTVFLNTSIVPASMLNLANKLVSSVPNVSPTYSNPHYVMDNNNSYLAIKMAADQYVQGKTITWRGSWALIALNPNELINICRTANYHTLDTFYHGAGAQSNIFLGGISVTRDFCTPLLIGSDFNLRVDSSKVVNQRYETGEIVDDINYSHSGSWPCSVNDLDSAPGSCVQFAVIKMQVDLLRIESSDGNKNNIGEHLAPADTLTNQVISSITQNITYSATNARQMTVRFNNPNIPGFYTVRTTLTYSGATTYHPADTTHPNDALLSETVSTYNCTLTHQSLTDDYQASFGQMVDDSIMIDGRCRHFDLPSLQLRAEDSGEVLLVGPLRQVPQSNADYETPRYLCENGGGALGNASTDCVYSVTSVPLNNASFNLSQYISDQSDADLSPINPGLYVYIYHFYGDVFTPEFWSNAADGNEMFIVSDQHVHMWSSATDTATLGDFISDTAYISGNIRPNSYLTFSAYGTENPALGPTCSVAVYDGSANKIPVGQNGGVYKSAEITVDQVGNVYWVATLHNEDGSIYQDIYSDDGVNRYTNEIIGKCGEGGETTHIKLPVSLSTNARNLAVLPDYADNPQDISVPIWDEAHIDFCDASPSGFSVKFELYKENGTLHPDGPIFSSTKQITTSGDYTSDVYNATLPTNYYWVASVLDVYNNIITQGVLGEQNETSHIIRATSNTAKKYVEIGTKTYDTIHLEGFVTDDLVLRPHLFDVNGTKIATLGDIELINGVKDYRTEDYEVLALGQYYWQYQIINKDYNTLHYNSMPNVPDESFSVIKLSSQTANEAFVSESFSDYVYFSDFYPDNLQIFWELYIDLGGNDAYDQVVFSTAPQDLSADNLKNGVKSPDFSTIFPATYYWVAIVLGGSKNELIRGKKRDLAETITIKPLTGTVSSYSETPSKAYVGEEFSDTVRLSGRTEDNMYIVWDLYKQSGNNNIWEDSLVYRSPEVPIASGMRVDENYTIVQSPKIKIDKLGKYYWVEKIYSPFQNTPITIGEPRLDNESIEILPLSHLITTTSSASSFARVNDYIRDDVKVKVNLELLDDCNEEVLQVLNCDKREQIVDDFIEHSTVMWKIYRKNLNSEDANDDILIMTTDEIPLNKVNYAPETGEISVQSLSIRLSDPGIYYWVEEVHSSLQSSLVAAQEMRASSETSIVEALNTKYIKIGTKRLNSNTLASTGISFGLLFGAFTGLFTIFFIGKTINRRRKKCHNQTNRVNSSHAKKYAVINRFHKKVVGQLHI